MADAPALHCLESQKFHVHAGLSSTHVDLRRETIVYRVSVCSCSCLMLKFIEASQWSRCILCVCNVQDRISGGGDPGQECNTKDAKDEDLLVVFV